MKFGIIRVTDAEDCNEIFLIDGTKKSDETFDTIDEAVASITVGFFSIQIGEVTVYNNTQISLTLNQAEEVNEDAGEVDVLCEDEPIYSDEDQEEEDWEKRVNENIFHMVSAYGDNYEDVWEDDAEYKNFVLDAHSFSIYFPSDWDKIKEVLLTFKLIREAINQ